MSITAKETIKKIKQTVYETSDGTIFTDINDAKIYQSQFDFEKLNLPSYNYNGINYYLINSIEEFKIFETYYSDFKGFQFNLIFTLDNRQFPMLIAYDDYGKVSLINKDKYNYHKQICQMYEKIQI